jgi:inosine-uridine nucleoside N-ribohydrolase
MTIPETLFLLASVMGTATQPVPIILDTDIGGDIDDTWALAMLLGRPEVDLKLIVTEVDNTPAKTQLVAKILERAGRTEIPIGTGLKTSDHPLNQLEWIKDYDLSKYPGTIIEDGVDALIQTIKASPTPITLITIGPVTNIREALKRDPSIAGNARVVAMAGGVYQGYRPESKPEPECNVVSDAEAFRALLAAPWDVVMTPLDGCGDMVLRGARYARLRDSQAPLARIVMENYGIWSHRHHHPEDASSVLFDTVAAYLAFDERFCELKPVRISVNDKGITVPDEQGKLVRCHLGWHDRDAFEDLLVESLTAASK